ncbi:Ada metal-binding domain-containing protein [Tunicatimonas pelagia]|uniref:Ada metal-binding domain-containing protein n=1 Tax=Tunicatimonas pelagia TaxID=931531 RepID=UPI002665FF7A|nr:Ada metal-binding domain-containing protein [Tunicatimonas pelagia]WKN41274.1 Ada metal-binding domain-containing protein [Tunicatimonas pelagia]
MINHTELNYAELFRLIKGGAAGLAGNRKLKIYGTLHCKSGKRMKQENRVFFVNEPEALAQGYRPCGHCMRTAYKIWKEAKVEN